MDAHASLAATGGSFAPNGVSTKAGEDQWLIFGSIADMDDVKVRLYTEAVAAAFTDGKAEVQEALRLICENIGVEGHAQGAQLLALRRYLRLGGRKVHANWAWTAEQAEQFVREGTGKALADEAAKVQRRFAAENPGYALAVSPLRSLLRQVRLWNANNSVQRAAKRLFDDIKKKLSDTRDFPDVPTGKSLGTFRVTLRSASVAPEPTSAAPGISDHGQMRAVDFVVVRGRTIIAGTQSSRIQSVWKDGGWESKLIAATTGSKLAGPLKAPYEPWHWTMAR